MSEIVKVLESKQNNLAAIPKLILLVTAIILLLNLSISLYFHKESKALHSHQRFLHLLEL